MSEAIEPVTFASLAKLDCAAPTRSLEEVVADIFAAGGRADTVILPPGRYEEMTAMLKRWARKDRRRARMRRKKRRGYA